MKKEKIFLIIIAVILMCVIVFSAAKLFCRFKDYNDAKELYEEKQKKYVTQVSLPDKTEEQPIKESPPISVDFDGLLKENKEIVGWIYCPDTPINYPVVQSSNNSEYLHKGINNQYLISGTVFLDFRNNAVGVDENYIMYGHNMKNQTMFGTIDNYTNQQYYNEHKIIYYLTPTDNYKIEVIAGKVVPYNDLIYTTAPKGEEFGKHIVSIIKSCGFKSDADYNIGDKIVTLSTCTDNSGKTRYVLIGKFTEF